MKTEYDQYTVRQLRELVWNKGLVKKRWMLNYIRKGEAKTLLVKYNSVEEVPEAYITTIKKRSSDHRKKVYQSRKDRQARFGAPLTRDERVKRVMNTAETLVYKERVEHPEGFTSYLGSTRGKIAFVFVDDTGDEYSFTKAEVQKMAQLGLYVPRGVLTNTQAKPAKPAKPSKRLKDLFSEGP